MHAAGLLWALIPTAAVLLGLLLLSCCFSVYAAFCYCCMYALCSVLEQYMFHYCIMLLNHVLLKNVLLKLNNPIFHQTLWNHSNHTSHTIFYYQTVIDLFQYTLNYSNHPKQIYSKYSRFGFIK
jgi:hypothetical protein